MKRTILTTGLILILAAGLALGLSSCGKEKDMYEGLNLDDYLTVGEYKGMEVDGYTIKVSDKDVKEKIDQALASKTENQELKKGDELKKDDTANIDYEGKLNGKAFEGGTAEGYDLKLGSGSFIPGFEDGLVGKKVGETLDLELTFPEDYQNTKLAGKEVVFTVKINSATRPKVPKYTEEFVKENTSYKSKEEYEKALKEQIRADKEAQAISEQKTNLWSDLLEKTEVKKYPEKELAAYEQVFNDQVDKMAEQAGASREDILVQYYGTKDEAQVKEIIKDSAQTLVKQEMLVEYIADKENLTYTDEEKQNTITSVEGQGYDEETVKLYTGRTMDQYAHITLLFEKVQNFLLDNAKVKK